MALKAIKIWLRCHYFTQTFEEGSCSPLTSHILILSLFKPATVPELWYICGSPCDVWILQSEGWAPESNPLCSWSPAWSDTNHKHFTSCTSWNSGLILICGAQMGNMRKGGWETEWHAVQHCHVWVYLKGTRSSTAFKYQRTIAGWMWVYLCL